MESTAPSGTISRTGAKAAWPRAERAWESRSTVAWTMIRTQEEDGCWWDTPAGNYGDKWGTGFALLTLGRFEVETRRRQEAAEEKQATNSLSIETSQAGLVLQSVVRRFEEIVDVHAGEIAIRRGQSRLTYGELESRANRLANLLIDGGACPGSVVALGGVILTALAGLGKVLRDRGSWLGRLF